MTFPAKNVSTDAHLRYHCSMKTSPEPITVSVTVLSQMFLYLTSLKVDIDAFLRSLADDRGEWSAGVILSGAGADGTLGVRPGIDSLLAVFAGGCRKAGISMLWERGTSPDQYEAATRSFLERSAQPHIARSRPVLLASPASPRYRAPGS